MTFEQEIEKLNQPRLVWQEIIIPEELLFSRDSSNPSPKDWLSPFSQNLFKFLQNWTTSSEKNGNSPIDVIAVNQALNQVFVDGNREDISLPILINVFSAKNGLMLKVRASKRDLSVHKLFLFKTPR